MDVTTGVPVEYTTTSEESTTPRGGASIGAHVSETNEQSSRPSSTVEEILESQPMNDDDIWDGTKSSDVSIDTVNSKEMMMGSHIIEQHTHKYQVSIPPELSNVVPNKPQTYNLPKNYQLDS